MMTSPLQIPINFLALSSPHDNSSNKTTPFASNFPRSSKRIDSFYYTNNRSFFSLPVCNFSTSKLKIGTLCRNRLNFRVLELKVSFLAGERSKNESFRRGDGKKRSKRVVLVRFNDGFGFNGGGGGGGGGGRDSSINVRALVNLVLAIVLTYFTMNGQLDWFFNAVVSLWLLAIIVPIVGLGAFLWWAGRDIVRSSCPNCGNEFQIFKSMLNDEVQLCPYCSQPFSVVGDKFVRDPVKFSDQTNSFDQASSGFSPRPKKVKNSATVVDIEAEIRDAE